jgi:hypothetical protein
MSVMRCWVRPVVCISIGNLGELELPVDHLLGTVSDRVARPNLDDPQTNCRLHIGQRDGNPVDASEDAVEELLC